MVIKNVLLPENICLELSGGPMWNTSIIQTGAGWEQSNINWAEALWAWKIRYVREANQFDPLTAFFLEMRGQAYGFLFKDWFDHTDRYIDRENGVNTSIGKVRLINGVYRLVKEYPSVSGGAPYQRIIQRPVAGTVTLTGVSGAPVVDFNTGIINGATSEGSAAFEFNVPVRFGVDQLMFKRDPATGELIDVPINEVRVELDADD